jgi:hypothetical protein
MTRNIPRSMLSIIAILAAFTTVAHAGPPLICHAIEIGQAKTLPWIDLNYQKGSTAYDVKNLAADTLNILDTDSSVLVHMETLRRAALYARQEQHAAKELLVRLRARAGNADAARPADALAWFDVGYLAAAYKEWLGRGEPNPAAGLDGYSMVEKAISLRGEDAEMEFGAALITLAGPEGDHQEHTRRAMAGSKSDPLLARNLNLRFNQQTMAELLKEH